MSGIERLEHIERFSAAHLSDYNPIRPHSQRGSDKIPNSNFALALRIGVARFHRYQIRYSPNLQLGGILDCHDAFIGRDKLRQRI
ncbi:hypothetical protein D3C79_917130 [compost metagenome]